MESIHASLQTLKLYSRKCRSTSEYPYYPYLKFESELLYITVGAHFWPSCSWFMLVWSSFWLHFSVLHHEASCPITTSGISNDFYEQSAMTWTNPSVYNMKVFRKWGASIYTTIPTWSFRMRKTNGLGRLGHPYWITWAKKEPFPHAPLEIPSGYD